MSSAKTAKLVRMLRESVADPKLESYMHRGKRAKVEAALVAPAQAAQLNINLHGLGVWHASAGQVRVLDGDDDGWDELRLGVAYTRTALLIQYRHWERLSVPTKTFTITPFQSSHAVALGLAVGDGDDRLRRMFQERMPAGFLDHGFLVYPRFVRALLALRAGRKPEPAELGVYGAVLAAWSDVAALGDALHAALDWHVERVKPRAKGDSAEFEDLPVFAFPAEVLAVLRVRESLSLPSPTLAHPSTSTPLGAPPPHRPWPGDRLLEQCEAPTGCCA